MDYDVNYMPSYTWTRKAVDKEINKINDKEFRGKLVDLVRMLGVRKDQVFQFVCEVFDYAGEKTPDLTPYEIDEE